MARRATFGLPFLILRSDSGKYAYWRNLPKEHAAIATGAIDVAWALKPRRLDGKQVIKISLKTGDLGGIDIHRSHIIAAARWTNPVK